MREIGESTHESTKKVHLRELRVGVVFCFLPHPSFDLWMALMSPFHVSPFRNNVSFLLQLIMVLLGQPL